MARINVPDTTVARILDLHRTPGPDGKRRTRRAIARECKVSLETACNVIKDAHAETVEAANETVRDRLVGEVDENVGRIQRMAKTLEYVARRGRWPEDDPTVRYGKSDRVYADVRVKAAQASIEASAKLLGYLGVKEPEKQLSPEQVRAAADALYGLSHAEDEAPAGEPPMPPPAPRREAHGHVAGLGH
jgi:hypothetical protein